MKIMAVLGSPHGVEGRTGSVVKSFLDGAAQSGAKTELFSLSELAVGQCLGCQNCMKTGKCRLVDDLPTIVHAMREADGYLFASPNQVYNVSGLMKVFIDRCFSACYFQLGRGRYAAAVVTSGGPYFDMVEDYLVRYIGAIGSYSLGSIGATQLQLDDDDERAEIMGSAFRRGEEMVQAIKTKKRFPEQEEKLNETFETMKSLVEMQVHQWPFLVEYWKSHFGLAKED